MGIWTIVGIAIVGIAAIVGVLMGFGVIPAPELEACEWSEHETRGPA
jgi:hypothetical protein